MPAGAARPRIASGNSRTARMSSPTPRSAWRSTARVVRDRPRPPPLREVAPTLRRDYLRTKICRSVRGR
jgi:hypothetical protein